MIKIIPKSPLGPYPQPELCGQVGNAPMSMRIKITIKIVPSIKPPGKLRKWQSNVYDWLYSAYFKIYYCQGIRQK